MEQRGWRKKSDSLWFSIALCQPSGREKINSHTGRDKDRLAL